MAVKKKKEPGYTKYDAKLSTLDKLPVGYGITLINVEKDIVEYYADYFKQDEETGETVENDLVEVILEDHLGELRIVDKVLDIPTKVYGIYLMPHDAELPE
jgi:hypothetical protein